MTALSSNEEKELLSRIAEGEEAAFSTLFYHYLGRLKPFISKYTKSEADVKEILQETFVRVWLHRDKLLSVDNPSAYIFRIAANQYHLKLRKDLSEQKALGAYKNSVQDAADTTTDFFHSKQLQLLVQEAVSKLPAQRRKIFLLSRQDGLTFREIAAQLNISPKTVKNAIFAALADIRTYLAAAGESSWCYLLLLIWL